MTVTRGDEHVFLGMKVKFNGNGTVNVGMESHLEEAIEDYPGTLVRRQRPPLSQTYLQLMTSPLLLTTGDEKPFIVLL